MRLARLPEEQEGVGVPLGVPVEWGDSDVGGEADVGGMRGIMEEVLANGLRLHENDSASDVLRSIDIKAEDVGVQEAAAEDRASDMVKKSEATEEAILELNGILDSDLFG